MDQDKPFRYRSLFWPIILVGVGVLWLLANLDVIPREGWLVLLRFWPVFLIGIGLDLIIGRRSPILGAAVGLGVVGLAVLLVFIGPNLGIVTLPDITTNTYTEPIGTASSARIDLDLSIGVSTITASSDSNNLFEAEISHVGEIDYNVSGDEEKTIRLSEKEWDFNFTRIESWEEDELEWNIGLSPDVPLYLDLEGGIGLSTLDLGELDLTGVEINSGVGDMIITLPATGSSYEVNVDVGVGRLVLRLEDGIDAEMRIEGGVGETRIEVPSGVGVRLDGEIGVGDIRVPSSYDRLSYDEDQTIGESGVWQSPNYASADHKINITFEGGVGDLTIR
ncbi:MAG: hypothetical protein GTO14_24155 [Anaerolineales bacterium]|nr:hypothetical protein [Anaerolineales bacterium]